MSKSFFKKINKPGELFIVIDEGAYCSEVRGLKLYITEQDEVYNNDTFKDTWQEILTQIPYGKYGTHILENKAQVFVQQLRSKPTLILCGAGHVSLFVYKVAAMVGFEVVVIDDREEFANRERFPDAKDVFVGDFATIIKNIDYGDDCYYVVVSRGHVFDGICLEQILQKKYTYVGMIGSKKKISIIYDSLRKNGFSEDQLNSVCAPIGLPINAITPEEISISIMAEVIKARTSRASFFEDEAIELISNTDEDVTLCMIVEKKGSVPRGIGAKMAITKSSIQAGTIGGGLIEHESKQVCAQIAGTNINPSIQSYAMDNTDAEKAGMTCSGSVLLYIEAIKNE